MRPSIKSLETSSAKGLSDEDMRALVSQFVSQKECDDRFPGAPLSYLYAVARERQKKALALNGDVQPYGTQARNNVLKFAGGHKPRAVVKAG